MKNIADNLPQEILQIILTYLKNKDLFPFFTVNKYIYVILSNDGFWYQKCLSIGIKENEIKKKQKDDLHEEGKLKDLYRSSIGPKILLIYSSDDIKKDTFKNEYAKHFPYCSTKEIDQRVKFILSKRRDKNILKDIFNYKYLSKFNVIILYGGNGYQNKELLGNLIYQILEKTEIILFTFTFTNTGCSISSIFQDGNRNNKFKNLVNTNFKFVSYNNPKDINLSITPKFVPILKNIENKKENHLYCCGGKLIDPKTSRVIAYFNGIKDKYKKINNNIIAICESLTHKHCYFSYFVNKKLDATFLLIKYFLKRKKNLLE